ncbi:MAG TPA: D-alanyl-D-alanine carboxypeptidase/D-alanyl-D-alanine-endopeptidase [Pyrinomonadaceae bacterium]|jgi:D-alanyl-D-alanine carboxypeptidase/D-alanyl-D-alanine-endopeptidase (penicillin-binding protein 4)|nr:D-alanyl-D-alanine carboxypeptidase/D-alanyl-D-alanine-endopeptidase [Pyrinomonadaceae bacterium]
MKLNHAAAIAGVFLTAILIVSLVLVHEPTGFARADKPAAKAAPANSNQNASPAPANDVGLAREIDRILNETESRQGRFGVFVMAAKNGRVLYARNSDQLFTPASNMKVYTTAVALDLLGADYRWRTSVYANKSPDANGTIDADLTLYGRGAPDLLSKAKGDAPSLTKLADQLFQAGVREVRGNIVGDNSYFRGELFGIGWQWNDLQWYFGAEPSALSIDENSVEVTIAPGSKQGSSASVVINPDTSPVRLVNETKTGEQSDTSSIGIMRDLSGNDLRVWGDFPVNGRAFSAFLAVHDPAMWAATLFKRALVARGIKVSGEARTRDFRIAETDKVDPQKSVELAYEDSEPLSAIIRHTNKESDNLYAELILRTIGKERGASVPDPDPRKNRQRGDDEAGTAVVRSWLESKGINTKGLAIRDGSGLSRLDLITPETTTRLLLAIGNANGAGVFRDSLPIAGRDGTLNGRLKKLTGRLFAKTGTLTYVHSLSGYTVTPDNETLVFSIMCNDATGRDAVRILDDIATAIADFRPSNPGK